MNTSKEQTIKEIKEKSTPPKFISDAIETLEIMEEFFHKFHNADYSKQTEQQLEAILDDIDTLRAKYFEHFQAIKCLAFEGLEQESVVRMFDKKLTSPMTGGIGPMILNEEETETLLAQVNK